MKEKTQAELEKGCGYLSEGKKNGLTFIAKCGEDGFEDSICLCEINQAQLTQTIEMKKKIEEMNNKIVNEICKDVSFDEMWIIDRLRKEFKQQVEKL